MKRVIVIGTTGSGKSTLAKNLSLKLNYPYIQLDKLHWKPNWTESSDEELFEKIQAAITPQNWILDGNYTRTKKLTWKVADTVIWIDLPFWLNFWQITYRAFHRSITQQEIWEGTNNKETFARMFSKHSIILWFFKTYAKNKAAYEASMKASENSHLTFYRLRSRKELADFLQKF